MNSEPSRPSASPLDAPRTWLVLLACGVLVLPLALLFGRRLTAHGPKEPAASATFEQEMDKAQKLLDAKRARESLMPLGRARRLRPDAATVHNNLCVAYGILERRDDAIAACRRALEIEPGNRLAKNNLAWVERLRKSVP